MSGLIDCIIRINVVINELLDVLGLAVEEPLKTLVPG